MKTSYTEEQKQELVKKYYDGESASVICLQSGVPRSTFYTWIKPYKILGAVLDFEVSAANYLRQKQHTVKLENMIEILRTVNCTITSPLQVKLKELEKLHGKYSVHVLCDSLDVARGTFYNHIYRNKKGNSSYVKRRENLSKKIKEIFDESNQIYGARKIKAVLKTKGINTTDNMVAELMQEMNLQSIRSDTKKQYKHLLRQSRKKDSLKLNFQAKEPNKVWVSDVTYFKVCNTTRYICAILDLYSRKVISFRISKKNSTQLISSSFKIAYEERQPAEGLIYHSDRGVQYTAFSFRKLLMTLNIIQSFSPSGKPCHNAVMESFFSTLKKEELYRINYRSIHEFEESVKKYMERYNNERPHVTLRYKSPNAFEQEFISK